ncbi:MAG TPA: VanZ family protein [Terriglobales bacterium]|nr:VanZ family protein [Terriglobales bacterium]
MPPVAWMAVVLLASSDSLSAQHTGDVLRALLIWLFGQVNTLTFGLVHFLVRKSAHFTEYAVLSALWFRALRVHLNSTWRVRWALIGLVISLSVAVLDELHQSFVPSRTSSARDVLLDFSGAFFAQFVIWYALRRREMGAPVT